MRSETNAVAMGSQDSTTMSMSLGESLNKSMERIPSVNKTINDYFFEASFKKHLAACENNIQSRISVSLVSIFFFSSNFSIFLCNQM